MPRDTYRDGKQIDKSCLDRDFDSDADSDSDQISFAQLRSTQFDFNRDQCVTFVVDVRLGRKHAQRHFKERFAGSLLDVTHQRQS